MKLHSPQGNNNPSGTNIHTHSFLRFVLLPSTIALDSSDAYFGSFEEPNLLHDQEKVLDAALNVLPYVVTMMPNTS